MNRADWLLGGWIDGLKGSTICSLDVLIVDETAVKLILPLEKIDFTLTVQLAAQHFLRLGIQSSMLDSC